MSSGDVEYIGKGKEAICFSRSMAMISSFSE